MVIYIYCGIGYFGREKERGKERDDLVGDATKVKHEIKLIYKNKLIAETITTNQGHRAQYIRISSTEYRT